MKIGYKHVQGGNVPGGHNVLWDGKRKPFITPMRECNSIPLRHSDVIVDIGAYVGTYAIRCARFPVKKVIAYEPTPQTFNVLALTELPNLEIYQQAVVADDRPSVDLFISRGIGVTNSIILSNRKAGKITVPAVKYEDVVAEASIVKIDVEGAEYTYPIIQPNLRAIIVDFHPIPKRDWIGRANEMIAEFEAAGFQAVISPDFSNGWTSAGSWIRDGDTIGEFSPMMLGEICCGCGVEISTDGKGICKDCAKLWSKRHKEGYEVHDA